MLGLLIPKETVTTTCGGTGNEMTAQRIGISQKNVTAEGCGVVNENTVTANSSGTGINMTTQKDGTLMHNETVEGCGMTNTNKVTANNGGNGTGMTAQCQWGSGITLTNENVMTVQHSGGVNLDDLTAYDRSGIKMTA